MAIAEDALVGKTIADRYLVLSKLGSGGFGSVYMGKHIALNNPVALKVLHSHLIGNEENVLRFRREAEATSRLRHNSIAGVFDVGVLEDGRPYMVMEYLSGQSMADEIAQSGALPVSRALPLFVECCDALRYAHRMGIMHRDIKPENIYIVKDFDGCEHAKLLDFGLAKVIFGDESSRITSLTETGTTMGTPWYMSPEQCQALPLDMRSDIYSLGCSMYEAIVGKRPFRGTTHYEVMRAHIQTRVPPINQPEKEPIVPPALEAAILRALEKAPNDRWATADEFKTALETAAGQSPTDARKSAAPLQSALPAQPQTPARAPSALNKSALSSSPAKAAPRTKKKSLVPIAISVAAVLLCVGLGGAFYWHLASEQQTTKPKPATTPQSAAAADDQTEQSSAASATTQPTPLTSTPSTPVVTPQPVVQPVQPVMPKAQPVIRKPEPAPVQETATQPSSPTQTGAIDAERENRRLMRAKLRDLVLDRLKEGQDQKAWNPWGDESGHTDRTILSTPNPLLSQPSAQPPANQGQPQYQPPPEQPQFDGRFGGQPPPGWRPGLPPNWRPGMPLPPGMGPPGGPPPEGQ